MDDNIKTTLEGALVSDALKKGWVTRVNNALDDYKQITAVEGYSDIEDFSISYTDTDKVELKVTTKGNAIEFTSATPFFTMVDGTRVPLCAEIIKSMYKAALDVLSSALDEHASELKDEGDLNNWT